MFKRVSKVITQKGSVADFGREFSQYTYNLCGSVLSVESLKIVPANRMHLT